MAERNQIDPNHALFGCPGAEPLPRIDVGLGTAYERLAVYQLIDRWMRGKDVRTAFEGPIDGMAGIPGLHLIGLARKGIHVTVALPDERGLEIVRGVYEHLGIEDRLTTLRIDERFADSTALAQSYDVVLTYNALPLVSSRCGWERYLERVHKLAKKYFIVSVTNPSSYGVYLRKAQRELERMVDGRGPGELFDHVSVRPAVLESLLPRYGKIVEHDYLDCPWWPDLFVPTGQTLAEATLKRLPVVGKLVAPMLGDKRDSTDRGSVDKDFLFGPENFPLLEGAPGYELFLARVARHPVFDDRGPFLGRLFGHHHAYLIEL